MEKGKLYSFHGEFEFGKVVIGKFNGIDETTGFVEFTDIVYSEDIRDDYKMQSKIAQALNGGNPANCLGAHGADAEVVLNKFKRSPSKCPKVFIRHNSSTYNLRFIHSVTPMKNYFEEA